MTACFLLFLEKVSVLERILSTKTPASRCEQEKGLLLLAWLTAGIFSKNLWVFGENSECNTGSGVESGMGILEHSLKRDEFFFIFFFKFFIFFLSMLYFIHYLKVFDGKVDVLLVER